MNNIQDKYEYVINLVNRVLGKKYGEIASIKPIHFGYTNQSYVVTYENKMKFQVRIPHCGRLIDRSNELQINNLLRYKDFIYFDVKTGIAIKKWINGKCPHIPTWRKWNKVDELFLAIRKIHRLKLPKKHNFKKINYDAYSLNLFRLKLVYQTRFMSIIDAYRDDLQVLNHTDINASNMIQTRFDRIHIIDFEWCGLASDYWDYANFIRETGIKWYQKIDWHKFIDDFDLQKLKNYVFICAVYAYLWTWVMPQTKKIKRYRRKALSQVVRYSRGVVENEE